MAYTVADLGSLNSTKIYKALSNKPFMSRFMSKHISEVSSSDVHIFKYALKKEVGREVSFKFIETIQRAARTVLANGESNVQPSKHLLFPFLPLMETLDDFVEIIESLPSDYMDAAIVCLEGGITPKRLSTLRWSDKKVINHLMEQSEGVRIVIRGRNRVRLITSDLMFWKSNADGRPEPLINIEDVFYEAFGCPWPKVAKDWNSLASVDNSENAKEFADLVEEETGYSLREVN